MCSFFIQFTAYFPNGESGVNAAFHVGSVQMLEPGNFYQIKLANYFVQIHVLYMCDN